MATGGGVKIDFDVEGVKEIAAALALLGDLPKYLEPEMNTWADGVVHQRLSGTGNYPPAPGGSTYQRTGQLGSSWRVEKPGGGQYAFTNATPYAGYVVGEDQAFMHRNRWWIASERIDEQMVDLALRLAKAVEVWNR
jgi:hypothetical protein